MRVLVQIAIDLIMCLTFFPNMLLILGWKLIYVGTYDP